ncbi:MAG TPA: hypothetical protein VER83_03820, partial [Candidatus Nanopelagicales bacterium]|nr:hypothetical protein [Candidatus Nanopelagicales bacterium]
MRWPFSLLFRGDRDASAAADAGVAGSGAPGAGPGSDPAADAPSRPAAWPSLPPVQRTIGDAPLTAPAVPFGRELAGLRPPERFLRPLAHDIAADGPAGLVSGIATPLVTRGAPPAAPADHVELPPPRGVQRRARTVSGAPVPTADAAPPTGDAEAGFADLPVAPPARVLPFVLPSGAVPALAATRVAASTAPEAARAVAPAAGAVAA